MFVPFLPDEGSSWHLEHRLKFGLAPWIPVKNTREPPKIARAGHAGIQPLKQHSLSGLLLFSLFREMPASNMVDNVPWEPADVCVPCSDRRHKWVLFKKHVRAALLGALLAHADGSLLTLLRTRVFGHGSINYPDEIEISRHIQAAQVRFRLYREYYTIAFAVEWASTQATPCVDAESRWSTLMQVTLALVVVVTEIYYRTILFYYRTILFYK